MDSNSTKLLTLVCPGKKVPIRKEPRVQSNIIDYASSGDNIEVYIHTVSGFHQLAHNKGYINKSTKGVEFVDLNPSHIHAHIAINVNNNINDKSIFISNTNDTEYDQHDVDRFGETFTHTVTGTARNDAETPKKDEQRQSSTMISMDSHAYSTVKPEELTPPVKWHTVYDHSDDDNNNTNDDKELQQKEEQQRLLHMLAPSPVQNADHHIIDNFSSHNSNSLSSSSSSSSSILQSLKQIWQSPRSTLQYYQRELHDVKTHAIYYYQQVGALQPWNEFIIFVKHPQCHVSNIDRRLSTNFLHYRSNYLSIFIGFTMIYTIYTFLFFPIVLLLVIPFLILTFYCLVVNKASITLGEITITIKGKRYLVILLLIILLGITGGLTKLIWILLLSSILCFIHMFVTPTDNILSKSQSV